IYTGSRSKNVLGLRWDQIDLEAGVMRRRPYGVPEQTTKRAPPVRLGRRILAHLRRWKRLDDPRCPLVVHFNGRQITRSLSTTWPAAVAKAGLGKGVSPHTLRHTRAAPRATGCLRRGFVPCQAAGYWECPTGTLPQPYAPHSPPWKKDAAEV